MIAEPLLWTCGLFVAYVYVGYPLLLTVWARLAPRPVRKGPIEPFLSILTAAYNEEADIERKIRNALEADYPPEKMEIVIASDGSTDRTVEKARALEDGRRVRVVAYPRNRGKLHALNDTVPLLRGEIIVFSDATSMIGKGALRALAANFADPEVGAVSGLYRIRRAGEAELGGQEDFYWRYETHLKKMEAALGSILGAHGALYAIRKSLYPFPSPEIVNDDYVIPIRIVGKGYRAVYEPEAPAWEDAGETTGFGRRVRIWTGNVEQLGELKTLLRPFRPREVFFFLSHKAARLAAPAALVAALAANWFLREIPVYLWAWRLQLVFYALAAAGALVPLRPRLLRLPYYFCMVNSAAFPGFYYWLVGREKMAWKKRD